MSINIQELNTSPFLNNPLTSTSMKTKLLYLSIIALFMSFTNSVTAQATGNLVTTWTQNQQAGKTSNVSAVWIENAAGAFIKTKMRYVGSGTSDHLPVWTVKSGGTAIVQEGGSGVGALDPACNIVDAATGATRKSSTTPTPWTTYTFIWNATNAAGTVVPDGIYKVFIEMKWDNQAGSDDGQNDYINTGWSFTKSATSVTVNPVDDTVNKVVSLVWTSTSLSVPVNNLQNRVLLYPNPSKGIVSVNFISDMKNIKVTNILGQTVYNENMIGANAGTVKSIDLSNFDNGIYIISVSNNDGASSYKVVLDK